MYKYTVILIISILLIGSVSTVHAEVAAGSLALFDRSGVEVSDIIDGNSVQLQIKLPTAVTTTATAVFFLDGSAAPLVVCSLQAGTNSCTSTIFPATGWFWNDQGISHAQRLIHATVDGQDAPFTVRVGIRPRPVVMVHGFISSWETWKPYLGPNGYLASIGLQGFAVGDGQAPGVMNTGNPSDPAGRTNSIAQNAELVGQYISGVQKKTGAEKVDLLVHSMGGMISRYYLDRVMKTNNVAQLIFLGSPMAGTACSYPLASLGFLLPGSLEILPDTMIKIFNQQIVHRQGIPFYMIAGTLLIDPLTTPCAAAPSDTVVALDSATSITMDGVQELPMFHGDLTSSKQVFETDVRHLLQSPPGSFAPRTDLEAPSVNIMPEQFSRAYTGHLKPGETTQVTINIDPHVSLANFSLYDSSRSVAVEVRGASGNVIQLDVAHNGLMKIEDQATMLYLGYGFKQPKPGKWVVTLKATDQTPSRGADYSIIARFTGGAALTASSSITVPVLGEGVTIKAILQVDGSNPQVDTATALVRKPDGSQELLNLKAGGDGFSADYQPSKPGLYVAEVMLAGKSTGGFEFDRSAFVSFEVQPTMAEINVVRIVVILALAALVILLFVLVWLFRTVRRRKKAAAAFRK